MPEHSPLLEHRCAVRHPVEWPVVLHSPSRGDLVATLVNIGAGGACIRLGHDPAPACRLVELLPGGRDGTHRWPALVVHRSGPFLGLMFDRFRHRDVGLLLAEWQAARRTRSAEAA